MTGIDNSGMRTLGRCYGILLLTCSAMHFCASVLAALFFGAIQSATDNLTCSGDGLHIATRHSSSYSRTGNWPGAWKEWEQNVSLLAEIGDTAQLVGLIIGTIFGIGLLCCTIHAIVRVRHSRGFAIASLVNVVAAPVCAVIVLIGATAFFWRSCWHLGN